MILFSWPVDQIVVDFTLPGHWRNTVFIFIIDSITFLDSSAAFFCFFLAVFLFAEIWLRGRIHTASMQTQPGLLIQITTSILAILANRSERMPAHEACRIHVV